MTAMIAAPQIALPHDERAPLSFDHAATFRQIAHDLDAAEFFDNSSDSTATIERQSWAATALFAVRLAGRSDTLRGLHRHGGGGTDHTRCSCRDTPGSGIQQVLCDYLQAPSDPLALPGHTMGLTLRRPWASMLMVPEEAGGKNVENRTDTTAYRGPVLIYSGARLDLAGVEIGTRKGLRSMDFHAAQQGWLGAAVLVDVHRARGCCSPWGNTRKTQQLYHWVFESPARLARRPWRDGARGFVGLQPVSWSALVNPKVYREAQGGRQ
ncbi:hypothetical protein [Mycobacterium sp. SMC-4]|jgi:hypothetical protein|uniref:hypothetical protein n=1 Tax=Mycobacterium sp. SMC-4 TaxID=2857059 RepID=UPI001F1E1C00|nr:hypothetical protein [Mycobacterium sp. SMC-4]MCF6390008.1 hypothetical protein [Mycobacterium sp. MBM]UXA21269.1 hypothetical protein KXD98_27595 [Mycobacterium sp. SMC-4]